MSTFVSYYRVSTKKQGQSGLGLDSQKYIVSQFIKDKGSLIGEFTEIESGKNDKRIELNKALALCKQYKATLVIAKLDRLSRNVQFIFSLKDSGVDFVCCDLPEMTTLTLGVFSIIAQHERELISQRTKNALAEKKRQGFKLGSPNPMSEKVWKKSQEIRSRNAREKNHQVIELVKVYRGIGKTYKEIADILNRDGYKTSRGNQFLPKSVQQIEMLT